MPSNPIPGHPIWVQIPATSVPRAQAFYTALFPTWTFTPTTATDSSEMCLISFSSPSASPSSTQSPTNPSSTPTPSLSAGIVKVDRVIRVEDEGASVVFFHVEGLANMLARVKEAGGEVTRGVYPEGEEAEVAQWRDTEGNVHGFFAWKEKE